jgi:hypothetical protein
MVKVLVTNASGLVASFGVNAKRLPYFFRDRDYELTDTMARKRIFHIVKAHQRSDGSSVKLHFRGERRFTWAGYDVEIVIPGKHRLDLFRFDVGMDDADRFKSNKGLIGSKIIGKWLSSPLNQRGIPVTTIKEFQRLDESNEK